MLKLGQVLTKARLSGLTSLAYFDFRYNVQRSFQNSPYDPEILLAFETLGHFFDFPNFLFCSKQYFFDDILDLYFVLF